MDIWFAWYPVRDAFGNWLWWRRAVRRRVYHRIDSWYNYMALETYAALKLQNLL